MNRVVPFLLSMVIVTACDSDVVEPGDVPAEVRLDTIRGPVVDLATGHSHACAVTRDGALYCWGYGGWGQLGNGRQVTTTGPVRASASAAFVAVTADFDHTCALDARGTAWCWGVNESGTLGHDYTDGVVEGGPIARIAKIPHPVETSRILTEIDTGGDFRTTTCAIEAGGAAWCWGGVYALGNGVPGFSSRPVPVDGDHRFSRVSVGQDHACAVDDRGSVWCWGSNEFGQVGVSGEGLDACGPRGAGCAPRPVEVVMEGRFASVSAGRSHTCALSTAGEAWCWGDGSNGQTGSEGRPSMTPPTPVPRDLPFASLAAGFNHTCGLTDDGAAWCWGNGNRGILGTTENLEDCDHGNQCSTRPLEVAGGHRFERLDAGGGFTCGLRVDGRVLCWGSNWRGALGNGSLDGFRERPEPIVAQE